MSTEKPEKCFHCEAKALIDELYPHGIDGYDAHHILMGLARIAGDILGNDPTGCAFNAFAETVLLIRNTKPSEIKFIDRTKH